MYPTENPMHYLEAVHDIGTKRYLGIPTVLILIWDWATQLDDEITFIWMWGWSSLAKPLYLMFRYGGIAANLYDIISIMGVWNAEYCKIYFCLSSILTTSSLYLVDIMLAYRVACLSPNHFRRLSILNTIVLCCCAIASVIMFAVNIPNAGAVATPEYLTGCWSQRSPFSRGLIAPAITFEIWVFFLVAYKVHLTWVENDAMGAKSTLRLVVRDQIWWFFLISAAIVWAGIQYTFARPTLRTFPFLYLRAVACICGSRLIVHVRKSYNSMNESNEVTLTNILFRQPTTTTRHRTMEDRKVTITASGVGIHGDNKDLPDRRADAIELENHIEMTQLRMEPEDLEATPTLSTISSNGGGLS